MAAAAPWVLAPLAGYRAARPFPSIRDYPPLPPEQSPLLSIIVPARNEEHSIERCVRSLLASDYPDFEVIAVNDRSTDETGAILDRLAPQDPRLRVVHGAEPPAGWFGKSWACHQGARLARGPLLLFTDADTVHGPALLARAVAMQRGEQADLVSLMPRQIMTGFWERVVQPHLFTMLGLRYGSVETINRRTRPRDAVANGQFILVTRASYDAIGGHEAVRHQVVEDVMLAQCYAAAGRRRFVAFALDDMATRMYTSLGHLIEGWSKNIFVGLRVASGAGPATVYLLVVLLLLLPAIWMAPVVALCWGLAGGAAWLIAGGAAACLGSSLAFATFLRMNREPAAYGAFFWLGAALHAFILLRTTARGKRHIVWKGRVYSHP